jgi:ribosomal protein S18 acetylase RimI-like enzyme
MHNHTDDSTDTIVIRRAADADMAAVAALFQSLSEEFIVHENDADSAAMFVRENDDATLRGFVAAGTHVYHVAEDNGDIVGFIAIRELGHIFHLFVAKNHHGRGLARMLWDVARKASVAAGHTRGFTVNASNHALKVYERFGFVPTAPLQCTRGLYYTPMALPV